jgi:hypothetical protein
VCLCLDSDLGQSYWPSKLGTDAVSQHGFDSQLVISDLIEAEKCRAEQMAETSANKGEFVCKKIQPDFLTASPAQPFYELRLPQPKY